MKLINVFCIDDDFVENFTIELNEEQPLLPVPVPVPVPLERLLP